MVVDDASVLKNSVFDQRIADVDYQIHATKVGN